MEQVRPSFTLILSYSLLVMSLGVFPENSCLPGIEPDVLNCTPKSANLALARRRWEKENEWYEMIFGPMRAPLGDGMCYVTSARYIKK